MKTYSPIERENIVKEVDELRRDMSVNKACKQVGVASGSYTAWKLGKSYGKKKKAESKSVIPVTQNVSLMPLIPTKDEEEEIMVFIGKSDSIVRTIQKLYSK